MIAEFGASSGQLAGTAGVCLHAYRAGRRPHDQEVCNEEIRQSSEQERGTRHAPREGWETSFGQRRQGHQPQASHRHRTFRGSQEGRQGPEEKILTQPGFEPSIGPATARQFWRNLPSTASKTARHKVLGCVRRISFKTNDRRPASSTHFSNQGPHCRRQTGLPRPRRVALGRSDALGRSSEIRFSESGGLHRSPGTGPGRSIPISDFPFSPFQFPATGGTTCD
jgi:hypothetical protein